MARRTHRFPKLGSMRLPARGWRSLPARGAAALLGVAAGLAACNALWGVSELEYLAQGAGGDAAAGTGGVAASGGTSSGGNTGGTGADGGWGGGGGAGGSIPAGTLLWAGLLQVAQPSVSGLCVDVQGNVAVVGQFKGAANFGQGEVLANNEDAYTFVLTRDGIPRWSRVVGGSLAQSATACAYAPDGSLVVAGELKGAAAFEDITVQSAGAGDVFVVRYGPDGEQSVPRTYGDAQDEEPHGVAVTSHGEIALVGSFMGGIDFGGGSMTSVGDEDVFVALLDPTGQEIWAKQFGDEAEQVATSVTVLANDDLLVGGYYSGAIDFAGVGHPPTAGTPDQFVASFRPDSAYSFHQVWGDPAGGPYATEVAAIAGNSFAVCGSFEGNLGTVGNVLVSDGLDGYLARYTGPNGELLAHLTGPGQAGCRDVAAAIDAVAVVGSGTGTLGVGEVASSLETDGSGYLLVFADDGTLAWSRLFSGVGQQQALQVSADALGRVIVAGTAETSLDYGEGPQDCASEVVFVAAYAR